jgi:hypothetical protein
VITFCTSELIDRDTREVVDRLHAEWEQSVELAKAGKIGESIEQTAWRRMYDATARIDRQIGRVRGWRIAPHAFRDVDLRTWHVTRDGLFPLIIDHATWYRDRCSRRPAAILSHTYTPLPTIVTYAAQVRLDVEVLPFSWYFPHVTIAIILTPQRSPTS